MGFNADDFRAALRPWHFTVGGETWEARPVSAPAVLAFHARFQEIAEKEGAALVQAGADMEAIKRVRRQAERFRHEAIETLLRRAFPRRFSFQWRGDPVKKLLALDPPVRNATLADFFGWAAERAGIAPPPTPTTPGQPSSPPSDSP